MEDQLSNSLAVEIWRRGFGQNEIAFDGAAVCNGIVVGVIDFWGGPMLSIVAGIICYLLLYTD